VPLEKPLTDAINHAVPVIAHRAKPTAWLRSSQMILLT